MEGRKTTGFDFPEKEKQIFSFFPFTNEKKLAIIA